MLKTECEVEGKENMEVEKSLVSIYNIYSNPIWCSQENPCQGKFCFLRKFVLVEITLIYEPTLSQVLFLPERNSLFPNEEESHVATPAHLTFYVQC